MSNVHPEILDGLDYESQFIQRTSGAQRRVVKLNRGDSWLLRFIPAMIGPNKRWYARVAKHWVNQRAIVCPRHTEEAFGGHPEAFCSVCELSEHLNNERNEDVSKFGFKLRATPNWVTYCAVFEKTAQGGQAQGMPLPEVLQPFEFPHYKTTWEELTGFVKQGARRCQNSVLDFEKGNDFWVSKTAKGLRLDKQDSGPIFNLDDPKFDENCQKLMAACKDPIVKIPDEKGMDTFADKAQEEADNIGRGNNGTRGAGGRGASRARDEDDLPPDDHPGRGRTYDNQEQAAPARGRSTQPAEAQQPARETRRAAAPAQEAAPAREVRRAAPATNTQPAAASARRTAAPPPPEPEQDLPPEGQGNPDDGGGDLPPDDGGGDLPPEEPQQPAAAAARRTAPAAAAAPARTATSRPSASRPSASAPARTANVAASAPARTAAPRGGQVAEESIDPEEHVPEEQNDQAPPQPLVDPADDTGAGDAPPPVENTRRGQFASNIRGKIAAVNASAKK